MKPLEDVKCTKKDSTQRRSNKPLMEKRRRARINNCLTQLKSLVLEGMKKDGAQFSKLEKADILEMTVKHLKNIQAQRALLTKTSNVETYSRYRAGFSECANEVLRYVNSSQEVKQDVKTRLTEHLFRTQICYSAPSDDTPTRVHANQPNTNSVLYRDEPTNPSQHPINTSSLPPLVMSYTASHDWQGNGYTCFVPTLISRTEHQPADSQSIICKSDYHLNSKTFTQPLQCGDANIQMCDNFVFNRDHIPERNKFVSDMLYVGDVEPVYASTYSTHALSTDKVWRPW